MNRVIDFYCRRLLSTSFSKYGLFFIGLSLLSTSGTYAATTSTAPPRLFFMDLDSGPNSGGESVSGFSGAYVTLYGNFFGTNPTVTLNSANCLRTVGVPVAHLWYQKLVVQLGPTCTSGSFIVSNSQGTSNGVSFTVRAGNIFCISPSGSNSNNGHFPSSCWAAPAFAKNAMAPGDITYVHAGTYTGVDGDGAFMDLHVNGGTAGKPLSMIGYPNENSVFDTSCCQYGILAWGSAGPSPYWTIANIEWKNAGYREIYWEMGGSPQPQIGTVRFIGNVVHDAAAELIVYEGSGTSIVTDGNDLYNMAAAGGTEKGYAVYWGAYGTQNGVEFSWNKIHNELSGNRDAKGLQFYGHVAGDQILGVKITNNIIFGTCMEGAVMGGSDGGNSIWSNSDTEYIYNNVFAHDGPCSPNYGYSAIKFVGGTGNFKVYNNTFYANGASPLPSPSGDVDDQGVNSIDWKNNLHVGPTPNGTFCGYICYEGGSSSEFASTSDYNDCWNFGSHGCPTEVNKGSHSLNVDPLFISPTLSASTANFSLQVGSPLIGAGTSAVSSTVAVDITGQPRPSSPSIGAYELAGSVAVVRPNPPTNLQVTVQ